MVHYVPTITFEGSLLRAKSFAVYLEELKIEEDSLFAAIATLLALYWAFNIVLAIECSIESNVSLSKTLP